MELHEGLGAADRVPVVAEGDATTPCEAPHQATTKRRRPAGVVEDRRELVDVEPGIVAGA